MISTLLCISRYKKTNLFYRSIIYNYTNYTPLLDVIISQNFVKLVQITWPSVSLLCCDVHWCHSLSTAPFPRSVPHTNPTPVYQISPIFFTTVFSITWLFVTLIYCWGVYKAFCNWFIVEEYIRLFVNLIYCWAVYLKIPHIWDVQIALYYLMD